MSPLPPTAVPRDDRGLTLGVGVFETLFVRDGIPAHAGAHLARMARGCAALGLPATSAAECREAADRALAEADLAAGPAALRLTLTGGSGGRGLAAPADPTPRLLATAAAWTPPPPGLTLFTSTIRRNASSPTSRHKTLSYFDNVLARAEAVAAGADEALMLNAGGLVTCAAAGNVFGIEGDALLTPPLRCGALEGVVRGLALRAAASFGFTPQEVGAPLSRLARAHVLVVTNSLIGAVPVLSLDGRALPPPTERVAAFLAAVSDQAWSTTGSAS